MLLPDEKKGYYLQTQTFVSRVHYAKVECSKKSEEKNTTANQTTADFA